MAKMNFDKLLAAAQKEFGTSGARSGSEVAQVETIPTGIPSLDVALGVGGWPIGGIAMIFGPESVGKSVLTYLAIAETQRMGKTAALNDLEGSFQPEWARLLGVDPDSLLLLNPVSAEETSAYAVWCANQPDIDLNVIDSIGAMASEKELDEDGKKQAYGQSGIITQMVKQLQPRLYKNKQACLLVNQIRDTANQRNLPIVHPPGGHALRHACAIIIQMRPGTTSYKYKFAQEGEQEIGLRPIATVTKNKLAPPKRNAEWDFYHTDSPEHPVGIDFIDSLIHAAVRVGVIERPSSAYYVFDGEKHNGKATLIEWIKSDPERIEKVRNAFYESFGKVNDAQIQPEEDE